MAAEEKIPASSRILAETGGTGEGEETNQEASGSHVSNNVSDELYNR